jgi:hypothetical protein
VGHQGRRDTVTEPSATEFGAFATAVGRRYGDRVSLWSIWNDPTTRTSSGPMPRRPPRRRPSTAGCSSPAPAAAREQQRGRTILMGETAPIGNKNLVSPLAFLRGALC